MIPFGYRDRRSPLHWSDARLKTGGLILLHSGIFAGYDYFLPVFVLLIFLLYRIAAISVLKTLWQIRLLVLIGGCIILSRALLLPSFLDEGLAAFGGIELTMAGLRSGLLLASRMVCAALAAHLYVATTSTGKITAAMQWTFTPIGRAAAGRLALMMGLALSFYPIFIAQITAIREAIEVRGLSHRRHPIRALAAQIVPVIGGIDARTEAIEEGLRVRCYSDRRTIPPCRDPRPMAERTQRGRYRAADLIGWGILLSLCGLAGWSITLNIIL